MPEFDDAPATSPGVGTPRHWVRAVAPRNGTDWARIMGVALLALGGGTAAGGGMSAGVSGLLGGATTEDIQRVEERVEDNEETLEQLRDNQWLICVKLEVKCER